ncbi:hypothetical protein EII34_15585, partial [Arachnia propionica]
DGGRWGFEHTPAGRLTATIDPLGARTEITHNTAGEVATVTDPLDRTTQSFHDDLGLLAGTVLPDGRRWEYTHDALSRLVAVTDPEGARWEYTHDVMGQVVSQVDPTGRSWTTGYSKDRTEIWQHPDIPHPPTTTQVLDRIGRVVSTTNPHGGTHHTRYDRCGRPVEHIDPDGGVTTLRRDPAGRVLQIHHPDGSATSYGYDKVTGRLASVTDALGHTTVFVTDADNRLVAEINSLGEETRYSYDPCGRVVETRHPVHGRSTWRYDPCGRVIKTWSRFLGTRHFHYDPAGQLIEAVDALGRVTRYSYDQGGRATTITDPLGHVTRRTFNHLDLNTAETDPLGRTKHHTYDAAGRLIGHQRATGERLEWRHDGAGQVHQIVVNGLVVASHEYDWAHNTVTVDDHTAPETPVTHHLRWDQSGRLVEQTRNTATTRWEHDLLGRCTQVTTPNGDVTSYGYDPLGHCTHITTPAGKITQVFDPAGRLVESHSPDSTQTWHYTNGQVSSQHIEGPDGSVETLITRDDDGRITAITRNGETTRYRHDAAGQLIETRDPHGRVCTWTYDQAGRLIEEHNNDQTIRYIHDAAGQLLERHHGQDITRYTYNADAKRITEDGPSGRIDYTWSALGWLTHINGPHGATSLHVNALSELARVNNTTLYWNTTSQPLQINDQAITTTWAGTAIGHQWLPTGWRTGRTTHSNPWDTHPATTIDGIAITPDGGLHIEGLEWLTHRVYQPDTRSFLTPDPLPPITGTAFTGNPYHYTGNNPLHAQDPLGLRPVTDEELAEYTHRHHTGSFWERNGTAVIGAGITIAGAIITFTPIPGAQIIGGVLFSGGMNIATQGFQKPGQPPDMIQVGINAAFGALGGGITTALSKAGGLAASAARSVWGQAGLGAGLGVGSGAIEGAYVASKQGLTGDEYWESVMNSALWGGIIGGASNAALTGIGKGIHGARNDGGAGSIPEGPPPTTPARGTSDVVPGTVRPSGPSQALPRRAAIEPVFKPRRSSGIEAPVASIPRRVLPEPQPRRALFEGPLEDLP